MDPPPAPDADGQSPPTTAASASLAASGIATAAPAAPAATPPTKRRRTAPVLSDCCRTCRLRKVKCSGNPGDGPCTNCARLDLTCNFVSTEEDEDAAISRTTPSHSHTEAGTLRKRAQRACSQCHSHKTKCSGDLPRCKRCEAGGLPCEYTPAKRRFTNVRFQNVSNATGSSSNANNANNAPEANLSTPGTTSSRSDTVTSPTSSTGSINHNHFALITEGSNLTSEEMLVRRDILLRHVDAYMDNMYWLPCQGFLHPDTTYKEIQEGTFDPTVAAAVCGITAVFVSPSDSGGEFGVKCSAHVEMYLFQNIYKFSDDLLVLFALSITFNLIRGEFAKLWQSFGVASRLMLGLRVNWDVLPQNQTFAQQECLRRIAWQLFYLDRMLAGGYEEYISCRAENMQIALPCSEAAFRENRPINAERLYDKPGNHPSTINLHGYQLRLIDLRHRIQVTTKRLCSSSSPSQPQLDASKVMADINRLQNELTRFHMSLPPEILLSDQTVTKYMSSPERAGYVFLHTHLAVSHIDLYRFSLPGQRDKVSVEILRKLPREFIARSQKQVVAHAMCLGRFCDAIQNEVDQLHDTGKLELAGDYSTFQMSTQCVRVLLVALQYGLYRDIADVTTAPLWRSVEVDEPHIRFLIDSVQRVTRPWCDILNVAQQAYDHNVTLVEDFDKTRKVADQRAAESMFGSKSEASNRLSGPDAILESIATGKPEEYHRRMASHSPSDSTRWIGSHPSPPAPNIFATKPPTQAVEASQGDVAPGIPLFLAQARNRPDSATQDPLTYDAESSLMPMGDLDAVLPDTNPLMNVEGLPMPGMHSGGPSMFQQAIPQPSAGFLMAQQSVFSSDVFVDHYVNRQHGQGGYPQPPGGY